MESNTYIISVDPVDLSLLSSKYIEGNGLVPLWSRSNLNYRQKEYCEFVIKTKDDESLDEENNDTDNVVCHICDIDVPKAFMKDHRKSFKHKFNIKIANVALKRLQRHVNEQEDTKSEEKPSKFYCGECSITVNYKDEAVHKKSITHKNSVLLESFLKDFLHYYTNDDTLRDERDGIETVTKENFEHTKSDVVKNDTLDSKEEIKTVIEDVYVINKSIDVKNNDKHNYLSKIVHVEIESVIMKTIEKELITTDDESKKAVWKDVLERCVTNKPNMNCEEYLKLLKDKFPIPMTLKAEGNAIVVKTIDGSQVRVYEEAFYGFNIFLFKSIRHCAVCKQAFALKNRDKHLKSSAHMKLMVLPLEDRHCVRKISDTTNHCVLCNDIFDNYDAHINSEKHNSTLNQKLISVNVNNNNEINESDANINKDNTFKLYNEVLKSSNDVDKGQVKKDTQAAVGTPGTSSDAAENANRRFCNFCNVWISTKKVKKHENTNKHMFNTMSDYHYMIKLINSDSLKCKICDVDFLNTVQDINKHFTSPKHNASYIELLNANNIAKGGKTFTCFKCNEVILLKNEILHIESKKHQSQDDKAFPPIAISLIETLNKFTVKSETGENSKVQTVETEQLTPNSHYCEVCNVAVPNNVNNIKMHEQGRNHMRNLELSNVQNVITNVTQNVNCHMKIVNGNLTCRVCDVVMTSGEINIATHLKGTNHINKYGDFLKSNQLYCLNNYFFCTLCLVKFDLQCEYSHVSSTSHIKNLVKVDARQLLSN